MRSFRIEDKNIILNDDGVEDIVGSYSSPEKAEEDISFFEVNKECLFFPNFGTEKQRRRDNFGGCGETPGSGHWKHGDNTL